MVAERCCFICWCLEFPHSITKIKLLMYTSTQARALDCWSGGRASHVVSSVGTGPPVSSPARVAAAVSRGWGGASCCHAMVTLAVSVAVSVVVKKKKALFMYPMGRYRCNPMSWMSSGCFFGMSKYREGISSMLIQKQMYSSVISTLLS